MQLDINIIISLFSLVITLSALFGVFYKMKYQIEELIEEQKKYNNLQERFAEAELAITELKANQSNIREDIVEIKGEIKDGRKTHSGTV